MRRTFKHHLEHVVQISGHSTSPIPLLALKVLFEPGGPESRINPDHGHVHSYPTTLNVGTMDWMIMVLNVFAFFFLCLCLCSRLHSLRDFHYYKRIVQLA